jgi:hypothetical protein
MPEDGSADSWKNPTYHGDLVFGVPGGAAFTDTEFFHAWTFSLSDEATVGVWVVPLADNMDTVMYLYRRDPGATAWGRYVARNDDFEGKMWSRLDESLGAGEYRVMVKGYKQSLRGRFKLDASCDGPGCGGDTPDCTDEKDLMPSTTGVAPSCVQKMQAVLLADSVASNYMFASPEDRCSLPQTVRLAWDYYYSYWDDIYGIDDFFDDPEEIGFDVDYVHFGDAGWLVGMDMGGDEDYMRFLFDGAGKLLVYYQSNQSPDVGWFCKDSGEVEDPDLWPEEFCVGHYLRNMTKPVDETATSGSVAVRDGTGSLPTLVAHGVDRYRQALGLTDNDTIGYQYTMWKAADDGDLVDLSVTCDGHDGARYMLAADRYDGYLYWQVTSDGPSFVCEPLE